MTTLKEIHESVKIINPWIPVLSLSHGAFKDTDCIGYIAGCRSAVQRVQVEMRKQDTTGRGVVQASAICRTVGPRNFANSPRLISPLYNRTLLTILRSVKTAYYIHKSIIIGKLAFVTYSVPEAKIWKVWSLSI